LNDACQSSGCLAPSSDAHETRHCATGNGFATRRDRNHQRALPQFPSASIRLAPSSGNPEPLAPRVPLPEGEDMPRRLLDHFSDLRCFRRMSASNSPQRRSEEPTRLATSTSSRATSLNPPFILSAGFLVAIQRHGSRRRGSDAPRFGRSLRRGRVAGPRRDHGQDPSADQDERESLAMGPRPARKGPFRCRMIASCF
jgi:hypothetical protein